MGDIIQAGIDRQKGRKGSCMTGAWDDKDYKYVGWTGRDQNDKIIMTRIRQERRSQNTDTQKTGLVRDKTPTNILDRSGRDNGNNRTLTHAGQDRLKQDIDTKTGQDSLARQVEARLLRPCWTGQAEARTIASGLRCQVEARHLHMLKGQDDAGH
jgi:hypothetical protein